MAAQLGADALILADIAMLEYAAERYPHIERHVSVQASATNEEAIRFYHRNFDVARIVLPARVVYSSGEAVGRATPVPLEVFAFGNLCIMAEGRCYLFLPDRRIAQHRRRLFACPLRTLAANAAGAGIATQ